MESEQCPSLRKHILFLITSISLTHLIKTSSFFLLLHPSIHFSINHTLAPSFTAPPQSPSQSSLASSTVIPFMAIIPSRPSSTAAIIFTVAFIFFLTLLPHQSAGGGSAAMKGLKKEESKKVIGSRPPACENKCNKCRPCMATLVVPRHQTSKKGFTLQMLPHPGGDDDTLLPPLMEMRMWP